MAKKAALSTEKTLQNQRIAIWLIVGFVAFITLWFVYSVKTLQNTSMTTSSEASSGGGVRYGLECTKSDHNRYKKNGRGLSGLVRSPNDKTKYRAFCCKDSSGRTAKYFWAAAQCAN